MNPFPLALLQERGRGRTRVAFQREAGLAALASAQWKQPSLLPHSLG